MPQSEYKVNNLKLKPGYSEQELRVKSANALGVPESAVRKVQLLRRALDARRKSDIHYVVSCAVQLTPGTVPAKGDLYKPAHYKFPYENLYAPVSPMVVGSGPAGIFCALCLARAGLKPRIVERGGDVPDRERAVRKFFETGRLDPYSNIQFGEGGAGTFSDGKLQTGTKDVRQRFVLETYVGAGAPPDILYLAKPHIGTDYLRRAAVSMRQELERLGASFSFNTTLADLMTENGRITGAVLETSGGSQAVRTDVLVLAPGNGARETFEMLFRHDIHLEPKNFAVGVRIEQLQKEIDAAQYGDLADFKQLPAADYKVTYHAQTGRPVYSFCVCPGGEVVGAASEQGGVVTNGMSWYARDGRNCNGALIVGVTPKDFGSDHPLSGIAFQRSLEAAAFICGGGTFRAPVQTVGDFLTARTSTRLGDVEPTYLPGTRLASLDDVLPAYITESLREALPAFGKRIQGFDAPDAVLTAVETRTSSPVRIVRDPDTYVATRDGLFVCGEGAGYAGGIMSAAVDGIRCAEKVCGIISEKTN